MAKNYSVYNAKRFADMAYNKLTQVRKRYEKEHENESADINAAMMYLGFALDAIERIKEA